MHNVLTHTTENEIITAIAENEIDYWLYRALVAGWQVIQDDNATWFVSGLNDPACNGILRTQFPEQTIDGFIAHIRQYFSSRHLPMTWWTAPTCQPATLEEHLRRNGFEMNGNDIGMVIDLPLTPVYTETIADLDIVQVTTWDLLRRWVLTFRESHQQPLHPESLNTRAYGPASYGSDDIFQTYLAMYQGRPCGTIQVLYSSGIAGIYSLSVIPPLRSQGIGTRLLLRALHDAQRSGYLLASIVANPRTALIARQIGFRPVYQANIYRMATGNIAEENDVWDTARVVTSRV